MRKIPTVRRTHCHKSKIPLRGVEFADAQKAAVGIDGWSVKRSSNRFFQGSSLKKEGIVVTNMEGLPLSSDLDPETTEIVAAIVTSLVGKALEAVRELREGSLSFLTLDTTKGQINIAPDVKEGLILVVLKSTT